MDLGLLVSRGRGWIVLQASGGGGLRKATRLLPAVQWQAFVAELRATYGKRPRLMALLSEAGP